MAKKFNFVGMHKGNTEGVAVGYLEGWVSKGAEAGTGDNKVANAVIVANNVSKKLAYALGVELPESESNFIDIAGWDGVADRMLKVVNKGHLVGVSGVLKTREYNGKTQLRFTVYDFTIQKYANSSNEQPANQGASQTDTPVDVSDDDLPF